MNMTNLINLYSTWYKDLDITVDSSTRSLKVEDLRTGSIFYGYTMDGIIRNFRDLGNIRKACGVL